MGVLESLDITFEEEGIGLSNEEMLFNNRVARGCKQRRNWYLFVSVVFGVLVGAVLTLAFLRRGQHLNPGTCSNNCTHTNEIVLPYPTTDAQRQDLRESFLETKEELDKMSCGKPGLKPLDVQKWIDVHHYDLGQVYPTTVAVRRCDLDCLYCMGPGKSCQVKRGENNSRRATKTVRLFTGNEYRQIEVTEHLKCECSDHQEGEDITDNIELLP